MVLRLYLIPHNIEKDNEVFNSKNKIDSSMTHSTTLNSSVANSCIAREPLEQNQDEQISKNENIKNEQNTVYIDDKNIQNLVKDFNPPISDNSVHMNSTNAKETPPNINYSDPMSVLLGMGFKNSSLNQALLYKNGNNLDVTIHELLDKILH